MTVACGLQVYNWFLNGYYVSVALGFSGYLLIIMHLLGAGPYLRPLLSEGVAVLFLWYGLYFGVLGRDCAEVAAERMVSATPEHD